MKAHTIICGYGKSGRRLSEELIKQKIPFVVIDSNEKRFEGLTDLVNQRYLLGDAINEEVLQQAGVSWASNLVITLPTDADNVFISLTARVLNPTLKIIARANELASEKKLLIAGANKVVMPDILTGNFMAQLISKPHVAQFVQILNTYNVETDEQICTFERSAKLLKPIFIAQTVHDLQIRSKIGCSLIALKNDRTNRFVFSPSLETQITEEHFLILLANNRSMELFDQIYMDKTV